MRETDENVLKDVYRIWKLNGIRLFHHLRNFICRGLRRCCHHSSDGLVYQHLFKTAEIQLSGGRKLRKSYLPYIDADSSGGDTALHGFCGAAGDIGGILVHTVFHA